MALDGPAPKGSKRRRNPDTFAWVSVEDKPFPGPSPELDAETGWPEQTLAWWEVVRSMPHCVLWSKADWAFALDTAVMHAKFVGSPLANAAELRLRSAKMGMTYEDRMKLRIRYVDEDQAVPEPARSKSAKVTRIDARRNRLTRDPSAAADEPS